MAATDGRQISINIRAVTGELTSGLNKAKADVASFGTTTKATMDSVEQSTERISRLWRAAFEAFLGVQAVNMLKKLALGAAEAADQLDVAARVAKNFGHTLDPTAMEAWLEAFARSAKGGGYSIDEMRKSVQLFVSLGLDAAQTQRAIADTASLAAARNMDWATAAHVVNMALTGHISMLTRYGVISVAAAKNIHTVEQAMQALEKATKGAAEQRAEGLLGTFGRLGTSFQLLGEAIGTALIPFFAELATVLTNLADLIDSIPAPILRFIGTAVALGTTLVAVVLILPALSKALAIVRVTFIAVTGVVGPLIDGVLMVGKSFATAATGIDVFALSATASLAVIAAVVVAIAGIAIAAVEMTNHLDHVKSAWHDWTQYLSDSFHEFVASFESNSAVLVETMNGIAKLALDTTTWQVGKWKGDLANIITTAAPRTAIKEGPKLGKDDAAIGADIVNDWKAIGQKVLGVLDGIFKSTMGKGAKIPTEAFTNLMAPQKGGKDTSPAAAENALKNFDETTKDWLAGFAAKVDGAKAYLDKSDENLADFDVKHPSNEPMTAADQAQRQKLVNDQLAAEASVRASLLQQHAAELTATKEYLSIAASISTHLKNHDQLVRQARDGVREHAKAARDINLEYLRAGTALDTILQKQRAWNTEQVANAANRAVDADEQQLAASRISDAANTEAIEHAMAMAQMGGNAGISFTGPATEGVKHAQEQVEKESRSGGGQQTNLREDRLKIALAELALATAQAGEAEKADIVAIRQHAYELVKSSDNEKLLTAAKEAEAQAALDVTKANDSLVQAQQRMQLDIAAQWNQLMNGLIEKTGMPGLTGAGSATSPLSFNPMSFLFAALEQTQTFGNVMATVTQIVQVFAQMLDTLKPVIDALLQVVKAVVNVFIFLYNMVARILDLFGLQVQQLNYLNSAIGGLIPLIQIWHEIPTLNELAAGKLNSPLSTTPQDYGSLPGTQGAGQNMLMKVVEVLTAIFAAVVIEKMISGMSLQTAMQSTMHLIGINMGQKVQTAAQQMNNSLTATGNGLLTQILTTLQQMLAAQQQNGLGSGIIGIFGKALGFSGGAGGMGGAGGGGLASGGGSGLNGMDALPGGAGGAAANAAQKITNAFAELSRRVQSLSSGFADLTQRAANLGNAFDSAARSAMAFGGGGSGSGASTALGMDMDRRISSTSYNINRVPGAS